MQMEIDTSDNLRKENSTVKVQCTMTMVPDLLVTGYGIIKMAKELSIKQMEKQS